MPKPPLPFGIAHQKIKLRATPLGDGINRG
jgi:hypothetical protein